MAVPPLFQRQATRPPANRLGPELRFETVGLDLLVVIRPARDEPDFSPSRMLPQNILSGQLESNGTGPGDRAEFLVGKVAEPGKSCRIRSVRFG